MKFESIGLQVPTVLFPKEVNLNKWAVVACDQYTSQLEYWTKVKEYIGDSPSTLNLIFPEVYLEGEDKADRIKKINLTMKKYLKTGVLVPLKEGFVLIDRKTSHVESRKGLLVALDLEKYDYKKGSQTLVRATEGTIVERLPPRIKIREKASIELPHIMVLIDDPERTVIEPLFEEKLETLYDFDLMMGGGHIKGYLVDQNNLIDHVAENLARLAELNAFKKKYQVSSDKGVLLYAVGDGNHSLATAKGVWENIKESAKDKEAVMNHPARYALVELVNIHDEGLVFEPIHRVMFNVDSKDLLEKMKQFYQKENADFSVQSCKSMNEMRSASKKLKSQKAHLISYVAKDGFGVIAIKNPKLNLEVGTLQSFLDDYIKSNSGVKIDYIHGDETVTSLGSKDRSVGFYLPAISKSNLFKTVIVDGALPRKTFSMGEADEKRFYLECRKITL